ARSALGAPGASGLVLTAEVGPLVLAPGDTLRTVLQVTNPGGDPLAVRFASGCLYGFALRDAAGAVVAPESPMCTMNAPVITFAAGESVVSGEVWVWDGAQPPPGEYDLTCGLGPRGEREHTTPVRIRLVGSRP
ncbi:hypothetical protein KDM41_15190, partial [bacterium]|nr:hypothetical protein [bacterium]